MISMARSYLNFKLPNVSSHFKFLKYKCFKLPALISMGPALLYPLFTERDFKNNSSYTTTKSSNLDNTRQVFLVYLFWI